MFLKKFLPSMTSSVRHDDEDDDDFNSLEYSFAIPYHGSPVVYGDVPEAVPVNIKHIPVAVKVASTSPLHKLLLPVAQPVVKTNPSNSRVSRKVELCSGDAVVVPPGGLGCLNGMSGPSPVWGGSCLNSVVCVSGDESALELSDKFGSSETSGVSKNGDESALELSDKFGSSETLGVSKNGDESALELSDKFRSSETLGVSKNGDDSCELLGKSEVLVSLQDHENSTNLELLPESGLSSDSVSSDGFSSEGENCDRETPHHVKRPSVVTFIDPEFSDTVCEESSQSEPQEICVLQRVERNGKKGSCYRCSKGNRFTLKEACIVCDAKYCSSCVLRAMGSMPEGRKCIACIGFRIDESKRETLGKSSRMLKWLLDEAQLKQVMCDEIQCVANQLPPESVYVNDEPLCMDELIQLQSCTNPPRKLRPGMYWYDQLFGFWGKQGEKPCQIITPQLKFGGKIKKDASNGNTNVLINNREITKPELWILQLAGEKCEGNPHFWLHADGRYSDEGQNNIKGRIWGKAMTNLFCSFLSLPIYSVSANPSSEEVIDANNLHSVLRKFLLVGFDKSGTSTIFKEAKIIYNVPFSEDERQSLKFIIQSNLYSYLGLLLGGRAQFEEEYVARKRKEFIDQPGPSARNANQIDEKTIYSIGPRLKNFSDWLLNVMEAGNMEVIFPAASREYAPYVEELWSDPAIKATYNRRNELQLLPKAATYFLEKAVEVSRTDYEPSEMDILYAEGVASSNRLTSMEFSFPKLERDNTLDFDYQHDDSQRYELIRVHPRNLGGNCKWLEMFEDVDVVLFCVSLIDYDQYTEDESPINKMMASKQLFENIVNHPTFNDKDFLLVLNKFDLFEEKIEQVPLTTCQWFPDFRPVISHNHNSNNNNNSASLAIRASHYIAAKFKDLFKRLTGERKLYATVVTGMDQDSVDEALRYGREVMRWAHDENNAAHEISSTSNEETTITTTTL